MTQEALNMDNPPATSGEALRDLRRRALLTLSISSNLGLQMCQCLKDSSWLRSSCRPRNGQTVSRSNPKCFSYNEHHIYELSISFTTIDDRPDEWTSLSRYIPSLSGSGHVACLPDSGIVSYHLSSKDICRVVYKVGSFLIAQPLYLL